MRWAKTKPRGWESGEYRIGEFGLHLKPNLFGLFFGWDSIGYFDSLEECKTIADQHDKEMKK